MNKKYILGRIKDTGRKYVEGIGIKIRKYRERIAKMKGPIDKGGNRYGRKKRCTNSK